MAGLGRTYLRGCIWWIAYYFRGKQQRESSHSTKEADAVTLLKKRLAEIGRGRVMLNEEKVTFVDIAADLERDYQINGKRSLRSVKLSIRHLTTFFKTHRAPDITTDRIRTYISKRQGEKAANASINRELSALKRMFSLYIEAGKLSVKPHVPMLEEANARQGFLSHDDFLKLRAELPEYLRDGIEFLYRSGWRVSEMKTLEWRDVDLANKVIRLRPEVSKNKRGRLLPLRDELWDIFARAKDNRKLECPRVFHHHGKPLADFRKAWHSALEAAGLGHMLVHDLRRTAIRNFVKAGVREGVAMALSGHKTRSVFDRYAIIDDTDLVAAVDKVHVHLKSVTTVRGTGNVKA